MAIANKATHFSGPVDSANGFTVNGTTIINSSGAIIGDIQATAGSIGTAELATAGVTSAKIDPGIIQAVTVTLTPTTIVGTAAGDLGHTDGVVLVAAEAGKIHEFISATLSYDFVVAAYTGGADDLVIRQGATAVSAPIAAADLLGDTADDIAFVSALSAADVKLTANSTLNIASTAWTQPGTAAGTCKVHVLYRTVAV
jgi:hypothetical protein